MKYFQEENGRIKALDTHKIDNIMIVTGEDDVLYVYNIDKCTKMNVVNS